MKNYINILGNTCNARGSKEGTREYQAGISEKASHSDMNQYYDDENKWGPPEKEPADIL